MADELQNSTRPIKFYMADAANPLQALTGLTTFTVYLSKANGAETTVSPTIVERGHGWYEATPLATHRDTLGQSAWTFTASGAVDYPYRENVIAADAQQTAWGANTQTPLDAAATRAALGLAAANLDSQFAGLPALIESALVDDGDATAFLQAVADKIAGDLTAGDVTAQAIASATRDAILDRVLAGNHDIAGTAGKLLQNADATVSSRATQSSVDAVQTDVTTLLGRITSTLFSGITSLGNWLRLFARSDFSDATASTEIGGTYDAATDSLQALRDRGDAAWITGSGGSGTGSGARTVTITVHDDAAAPITGAAVRLTDGIASYLGYTDAAGDVVFAVDDGSYTVAISKVGYLFTPATLAVAADLSITYSMTPVSITPPPTPDTATGVLLTLDATGQPESGVCVTVQMVETPGTAGVAYDADEWIEQSDDNGIVQFAGLVIGATYAVWRGTSRDRQTTFTVPSGTSFNIADVIGSS